VGSQCNLDMGKGGEDFVRTRILTFKKNKLPGKRSRVGGLFSWKKEREKG